MEQTLEALEFNQIREALVNLAISEEAREKLAVISPFNSVIWVKEELSRVNEARGFINRDSRLIDGGLKDIRQILQKVSIVGSILTVEELLIVLCHLRTYQSTRKILNREREKIPLIYKLSEPLEAIPNLETRLETSITPEATIRDNATRELSRLRRSLIVQQNRLRNKLSRLLPSLAKQGVLREESFTIRDGRYVLPVRSDAFSRVNGIILDRSASGGTLFVEPTALIDLGNELRSLELAEREEVRRILMQLTDATRENIHQIQDNQQVMTGLDCLWAKAYLAEKLDAVVPVINMKGHIRILGGRHPLLALDEDRKVVSLTLELGIDWTTLVISGPNAGGKSVALKCVGLLCVMMGCGLHIPALPGTELPLFEDVHADIGDQQSISDDLSTFTAHIAKLKEILDTANSNTLVLIDEIGAGTDPHEGSSLSIAALEKLTKLRIPTIVTTHHGTLKAFAHSTEGCANGSMDFDLKTLQPTYHFRHNVPGSSYALEIARRAGLSDGMIVRARDILGSDRARLEDLITSLSEKVRQYESLVVDEKHHLVSQKALEDSYHDKLEQLKIREREFKKKARAEAKAIADQARRTIESVVRELRETQADKETIQQAHKKIEKLKKDIREGVESVKVKKYESVKVVTTPRHRITTTPRHHDTTTPQHLNIGDKVIIDDSSAIGEVTQISSRGDRICIAVGAVQLWVTSVKVRKCESAKEITTPRHLDTTTLRHPNTTTPHPPNVPLELDIRGLDAQQAIKSVESYLYDGDTVGRERLAIIHGKGTGVLSKTVQDHLKNHPLVKSYRFGEFGEGDYGVTVVFLK
ncbi:MAG: endonuclease MutS2 [Candidatus Hatepunaea meridiana]|nr:endonuclease MutS2 [Candidatus Hatepunaea meridiana]